MAMKRREFFPFLVGVVSWPFAARAQTQPGASQAVDDAVGQIATLQGGATVTRGKAAARSRSATLSTGMMCWRPAPTRRSA
jgi:hypothetical protein